MRLNPGYLLKSSLLVGDRWFLYQNSCNNWSKNMQTFLQSSEGICTFKDITHFIKKCRCLQNSLPMGVALCPRLYMNYHCLTLPNFSKESTTYHKFSIIPISFLFFSIMRNITDTFMSIKKLRQQLH